VFSKTVSVNRTPVNVFAAYGWKPDWGDEEILPRRLELNLERAK
jgi:hypothetical protein